MSSILKLIISIVVCILAGVIGSWFTIDALPVWYESLQKPEFNPPNWVFAPVWNVLYIMMGISLFLVWREGTGNQNVKPALTLFTVQLILNILWSVVFFGMRSISGGLVIIILLWIAIVMTMVSFFRVFSLSGIMLIPYLLWVSFAAILNFSFYRLN